LTRCSQGQGAWAWQYLQQWLGLQIDHNSQILTLAPQGLVTSYSWAGFRSAENCFDLAWEEGVEETVARVTNHNPVAWTLKVGFRARGAGALGDLTWQQVVLPAQGTATLRSLARPALPVDSLTDAAVRRKEAAAFSSDPAIVFRRYGPAMLWGHWDARKFWQPEELPNALRFLVFNNSAADWEEVTVTLILPEGWKAQPRQPGHWDRPDHLESTHPVLSLGRLAAGQFIVAPFWLLAPNGKGLLSPMVSGGFGSREFSSHLPSQPGEGIRLVSAELSAPQEVYLSAVLQAFARGTVAVEVKRDVPIFLEAPSA
jgi:hypothetical protein